MRWSNKVYAALPEPRPMSLPKVAETLASGLAHPLFSDLLANVHLYPEHEVDLERVIETLGLRFSRL